MSSYLAPSSMYSLVSFSKEPHISDTKSRKSPTKKKKSPVPCAKETYVLYERELFLRSQHRIPPTKEPYIWRKRALCHVVQKRPLSPTQRAVNLRTKRPISGAKEASFGTKEASFSDTKSRISRTKEPCISDTNSPVSPTQTAQYPARKFALSLAQKALCL